METPTQLIKHEKRKGLVLMGVISLGLLVFGAGFYFAGIQLNTDVAMNSGIIMAVMGVIGIAIYIWSRKNPPKPPPSE